ncbi:MAG: Smr/MutS family protein [Erysipelotrichaceae bacterium]|nr:Smr/MutS family protein [Erysipelotrichaceae bacterium]
MLDNLPTLDLHGEYKESAIILTDEFINDNIVLKNSKIVVVHGLGSDILRKSLHEHLKHDKRVKEFKRDFFNPGATVIVLDIDK